MVFDPIPQSLPVHFFVSRPQPPTSHVSISRHSVEWRLTNINWCSVFIQVQVFFCIHGWHERRQLGDAELSLCARFSYIDTHVFWHIWLCWLCSGPTSHSQEQLTIQANNSLTRTTHSQEKLTTHNSRPTTCSQEQLTYTNKSQFRANSSLTTTTHSQEQPTTQGRQLTTQGRQLTHENNLQHRANNSRRRRTSTSPYQRWVTASRA